MILAGVPAQALEPLALYDDFEAAFINADKWSGEQSGRLLEVVREIGGKPGTRRLELAGRAFGNTTSDVGTFPGRLRLAFAKPDLVTGIKAKVEVRKVEATGCPFNSTPTMAQTRISGFFFKSAPAPGGVNDVLAFVRIRRFSDSTDPKGFLQVRGVVFHCGDLDCFNGTVLQNVDLGLIARHEAATLRIEWDQFNHQFIFKRDDQPEVFASYAVSDELPPGIQQKRIEIAHEVANCLTPGPAAFMEVRFDDVFVNESAVP